QQERLRARQAERLRGLHIHDQLELGGLLDGKVGGFGALENLVHKDSRLAVQVGNVYPVADQATGFREVLAPDRREPLLGYELRNPASVGTEKIVLWECDGINPLLGHRRKDVLELVRSAHFESLKPHLE